VTAFDQFDKPHTSWVVVPSVGISQFVADYTDCSGQADPPRVSVARTMCSPDNLVYLVGHNPGTFAPLLGAHPGDLVRYWDHAGQASTFRIAAVERIKRYDNKDINDRTVHKLVMQTCATADGSQDWIFRAFPA
jgi:hypothetical protein